MILTVFLFIYPVSQRKLNRLLSVPAKQRRTPTPPPHYEDVIKGEVPIIQVL